jgi:hypothetical protein
MGYYQRVWLVCEILANPPSGPSHTLELWGVQDQPACQMRPINNQNVSSIFLVIQTLSSSPTYRYLLLETDHDHFSQITESMILYKSQEGESNQIHIPQTLSIPTIPLSWNELTIEEYPLVVDSTKNWCNLLFRNRPSFDILQKRNLWRHSDYVQEDKLEIINNALAPFGLQLSEGKMDGITQLFDLKRGEQMILQNIDWYSLVSVAQSGSDFALMVEARSFCGIYLCGVEHYIIQKDKKQSWDSRQYEYNAPLFISDDLYIVRYDFEERQIQVTRNGKEIFRFAVVFGAGPPKYYLWTWNGHWILSIDSSFIFKDGKSLNRELGINEIFHIGRVKDKLLFFFNERGKIRIEYGGNLSSDNRGQILPVQYDDVIRTGCCGCTHLNGGGNEHMVWFYALRDSTWYYVEIGNYEEGKRR